MTAGGQKNGHTLFEVILVIIILGIISAITFQFFTGSVRLYRLASSYSRIYQFGRNALARICRDTRSAEEARTRTMGSDGRLQLGRYRPPRSMTPPRLPIPAMSGGPVFWSDREPTELLLPIIRSRPNYPAGVRLHHLPITLSGWRWNCSCRKEERWNSGPVPRSGIGKTITGRRGGGGKQLIKLNRRTIVQ